MVKNRDILKRYFETGNLPTAANFEALIDSMVHRDELVKELNKQTRALQEKLSPKTQVDVVQLPLPYTDVWHFAVKADGEWHPLISIEKASAVFEIVAQASGGEDARDNAVVQAFAAFSHSAQPQSIKQIHAYAGWRNRRRVVVRWKKDIAPGKWLPWLISTLFKRVAPYKLYIRSYTNYGEQGMIRGTVTQKWGDPLTDLQKHGSLKKDVHLSLTKNEKELSAGAVQMENQPASVAEQQEMLSA